MKTKFQLVFAITLILTSSCSHYIDKHYNSNNKIVTKDFEFESLKDENIFTYTSQLSEKRDNEVILNTKFKIELPKNIKSFKINNISNFIFYCSQKQYFVIHLDNENRFMVKSDSLYIPNNKDLDAFIEENSVGIEKKGFRKTDRKFYFFKKGHATILLYNIKSKNIDVFINSAKSLSFL